MTDGFCPQWYNTPDWAQAIDITNNINNYTVPSDGWIMGAWDASNNTTGNMFINSILVSRSSYISGRYTGPGSIQSKVSKGDVITMSTGIASGSIYFVPHK